MITTWMVKAVGGEVCARAGCSDAVEAGIVVVRVGDKKESVCFHAVCWVVAASSLAVGPGTGRRRLDLEDEVRVRRLSMLRKYAALKQRIGLYSSQLSANPDSSMLRLRVLRQYLTRAQYHQVMAGLGGVPRSWGDGSIPEELLHAS